MANLAGFISDDDMAKLDQTQGPAQPHGFVSDEDMAKLETGPKNTKTQSALEGFGNAGTMGYLPELQASAGSGKPLNMSPLALMLAAPKALSKYIPGTPDYVDKQLQESKNGEPGFTINQPIDNYENQKKENIERQQLEAKEHPGAYYGGAAAGALATAPLAGRALGLIPGLAAAPEAGLLVKTAQGAGGGALMGAAQNPGDRDTVGESLAQRGKNAITGGLMGGAGTLAAQGIAKGLQSAEPVLQNIAESKAFKAIGAMKADMKEALKKKQLSALGRTALDNGLVSAGDSVESSATKVAALQEDTGKQIGDIYKNVMSKVNDPQFMSDLSSSDRAALQKSQIDPTNLMNEFKNEFKGSLKGKIDGTASYRKLSRTLDEIAENGQITDKEGKVIGSEPVSIDQANSIKRDLDSKINYAKTTQDLPTYQKALKDVRTRLKDQINAHVGTLDKIMGSEDSSKLIKLNDLYNKLSDLNETAVDRLAAENSNRAISLTDTIAGSVGAATGAGIAKAKGHDPIEGAAMGLGLGLANKLGRTYGPGIMAAGANRGAQALGALRQVPGAGLIGQGLDAAQNASSAGIGAGAAQTLKGPPDSHKKGPVKR